jgi:ribosome biogenesis protein BMS1
MKNPRPLIWRNSHPYSIVDNFRDITHPTKIEEDSKCDRTIVLSGYLRGTNFSAEGQRVHIPGLGDFAVQSMESLPDPCPTPQMEQALAKATGKKGRRRLDEKEKKLFAPMSDRSGLKIDGDAIWITRERGFNFDKDATDVERGEGEELIINLQGERRLLGQTDDGMQLFRGGEKVTKTPDEEDSGRKEQRTARFADRDEDEDNLPEDEGFVSGEEGGDSEEETEFSEQKLGKVFRQEPDKDAEDGDIAFADSDSDLGSISGDDEQEMDSEVDSDDDDDDEEAAAVRWKSNIAETTQALHGNRPQYRTADLARLMYNESLSAGEILQRWRGEVQADEAEEDIEASDDEEFFKASKQENEDASNDNRATPVYDYDQLALKWTLEDNIELLLQRFTTATLNDANGENAGSDDDGPGDEDDEGDGAFEDLEVSDQDKPEPKPMESLEEERLKNAKRKAELKLTFEEEDREGFNNDKAISRREGVDTEEFGEDDFYDLQKARIQKQLDINKAEFEALDERQRVAVEGYKAGKYAQLIIEGVPAEFVENFNTRLPIIVGGLAATEDRFGFIQVR